VHLPTVQRELDGMAATLVDTVNAIHTKGETWSGTPPAATAAGNFFRTDVPTTTVAEDKFRTARFITLDPAIAADSRTIASASAGTGPSNTAVALQLAGLRDTSVTAATREGTTIGSGSLGSVWRDVVTRVGLGVHSAQSDATVRETLASNADARRQSVSGVSSDDELVMLIKHQQAYAAAARLVSVADEMSKILVDLGR
jgi:flagellar hook-associated protein 1 FlgK